MKYLALVLALGATAATANDTAASLYSDRPLDFSLYFEQADFDLDYGTTRVDTSVDRIGIAWRERYGKRVQLGLFGGYSFLTQGNNAPTAGRELDGYHVGITLDLDLGTAGPLAFFLQGAWRYQRVEDEGAQRVVISTNEPSARLGAAATFGAVRVYGGVRHGRIDGEQRLSGTTNETRDIEETDRTGGFAGLELNLEREGYIGITAESGHEQRAGLYFGRRF